MGRLLVKNVRIFDGLADRLSPGHVLIEGTKIAAVETSPIAEDPNTVVIDGADRVLMPGMSDAHVHLVGMANTMFDMMLASNHNWLQALSPGPRTRCCVDSPRCATWRVTPSASRT